MRRVHRPGAVCGVILRGNEGKDIFCDEEELARHYLRSSASSGAEISFLLGCEDPNSFSRAFHAWTGETPEQARTAMR